MEQIMTETDYLNALLDGKGTATPDQQAILEHPRKGARSTLVRIKGEAGTGKTFCLLAKLLAETATYPASMWQHRLAQGSAWTRNLSLWNRWKRQPLLFVCFNREMANYARTLLKPFPQAALIHVTTFDSLVVGLMRDRSRLLQLGVVPADATSPLPEVDYRLDLVHGAMEEVAHRHPELASRYYLDASNVHNVHWMADELSWLEASYSCEAEGQAKYPTAPREGRGSNRRPSKEARAIILEVWQQHRILLADANRFTLEQAVKHLMGARDLPRYGVIAIDEAQDLSLRSIRLLLKMRSTQQARVYLSADEGQKIYQRDFSWRSLDANATGATYMLRDNKRNSAAVRDFAERLRGQGEGKPLEVGSAVHLVHGDQDELLALAADLAKRPGQTTMLVGGSEWDAKLRAAGVKVQNPVDEADLCRCGGFVASKGNAARQAGAVAAGSGGGKDRLKADVTQPGLYVMGEMKAKGLEFDNVIVPNLQRFADDDETERRLRYVHFSRARKQLYVFTGENEPSWVRETYPELL